MQVGRLLSSEPIGARGSRYTWPGAPLSDAVRLLPPLEEVPLKPNNSNTTNITTAASGSSAGGSVAEKKKGRVGGKEKNDVLIAAYAG